MATEVWGKRLSPLCAWIQSCRTVLNGMMITSHDVLAGVGGSGSISWQTLNHLHFRGRKRLRLLLLLPFRDEKWHAQILLCSIIIGSTLALTSIKLRSRLILSHAKRHTHTLSASIKIQVRLTSCCHNRRLFLQTHYVKGMGFLEYLLWPNKEYEMLITCKQLSQA